MASYVKGYSQQFPQIIIDKDNNTFSGSTTIAKVTVEWVSDIEHHTHKLSELIDDRGNFITSTVADNIIVNNGGDISGDSGGGSGQINPPISQEMLNKINALIDRVDTLEEENVALKNRVFALENGAVSTDGCGLFVGDWDVEQEGNQSFDESNTYQK